MTDTAPFSVNLGDTPPASVKRGPGRPKGSTNKPKPAAGATDAATLRQAIATMDSLYNFTSTGLLMAGLTETAVAWTEAAAELTKRNEDALKASPRLAKAIANAGGVGGGTAFAVSHVMAIASVMNVARRELAARRAERHPAPAEPDPTFIPDTPGSV